MPYGSASERPGTSLPPGQHAIDGFPRFGTHLHQPPPRVPQDPGLEVIGAVSQPVALSLSDLAELPRRELTADFHCVAGWSATNLHWEGVPFAAFYRSVIEPRLEPDASISHIRFRGLDGYQWTALAEDALAEDVLLADRLDGHPLNGDHGAPLRLVSPRQYGYVNVKHLSCIELLTREPPEDYGAPNRLVEFMLRSALIKPHRRGRVWHEERHRYLPGWSLRRIYRLLIPPIRLLSQRGRSSG